MLSVDGRRRLTVWALQIWDLLVFLAALGLAWKFHFPGERTSFFIDPHVYSLWVSVSMLAWHVAFRAAKLYQSRRLSGTDELRDVFKAASIGTGLTATLALILNLSDFTLQAAASLWFFATLLSLVSRLALRQALKLIRLRGRNLRLVLIVGSGPRARELVRRLERHAGLGYRVIGCIDDGVGKDEARMQTDGSIRWLGDFSALPEVLAKNVIDEVFVSLPFKSFYDSTARIIEQCREQGIPVKIHLDLFDIEPLNDHIDMLDGMPVISLAQDWGRARYVSAKRLFDLVGATVLLVALSPLLAVIAVLIKLDSTGPVVFRQTRVGLNKRHFVMYKFRSMVVNGEALRAPIDRLNEAEGPVFKMRNDPRVTSIGRFLRATSMDELLQLVNVMKGEMSLVGPRPLPLRDVEGFTVDWQRRRFSVKPGITCLWQVMGRSSITFERWMELDMDYIDNRSLWLDLKILARTVPAVFRRSGAY